MRRRRALSYAPDRRNPSARFRHAGSAKQSSHNASCWTFSRSALRRSGIRGA
jgi:hypothetical protein